METKLITKTIKELADEYDGNVEQLHREIRKCNDEIIELKKENESLKYGIEFERWGKARAVKRFEVSFFTMYVSICVLFAWIAINIL